MNPQLRPTLRKIAAAVVSLALPISMIPASVRGQDAERIWSQIAPFFGPAEEFIGDYGDYRSPLKFYDGRPVEDAADWQRRRSEILAKWREIMGPWPALVEEPEVEPLERMRRENFVQHKLRFAITPRHKTEGYLLIPDGDARRPAVVVVYYEPETGIGLKGENRDFAYQLAKRGFVALSMGLGASLYYPEKERAQLQPLSALAYAAANAHQLLAKRSEVDPERIGIVGHSYGGKWAMFASCLHDKYACAAWSDGGVVFDESRPNVNYWEPWYLGYEVGRERPRGVPSDEKPRTGAYKFLFENGHDLHELHALMAPRPFLVSGGSEDQPHRWRALNHAVAVNKLLGNENRVAMTNRPKHSPTPQSNEQIYLFFEYFLKYGGVRKQG